MPSQSLRAARATPLRSCGGSRSSRCRRHHSRCTESPATPALSRDAACGELHIVASRAGLSACSSCCAARRPRRRTRLAQAARAAALGRTTIRWPTLRRVAGPLSTGPATAGAVRRHRRALATSSGHLSARARRRSIRRHCRRLAAAARSSATSARRCSAAALLSCARARSAVAASRRRRSPRRPPQAVCSSEQCV